LRRRELIEPVRCRAASKVDACSTPASNTATASDTAPNTQRHRSPDSATPLGPDGGYPGGNTASGASALFSDTTGDQNTAIGWNALFVSTTGNNNTAVGDNAPGNSTNGNDNTAAGHAALGNNPPGDFNTAAGSVALLDVTGSGNTAILVMLRWRSLPATEMTMRSFAVAHMMQ
jgi:hypothetical protein